MVVIEFVLNLFLVLVCLGFGREVVLVLWVEFRYEVFWLVWCKGEEVVEIKELLEFENRDMEFSLCILYELV